MFDVPNFNNTTDSIFILIYDLFLDHSLYLTVSTSCGIKLIGNHLSIIKKTFTVPQQKIEKFDYSWNTNRLKQLCSTRWI